MKLSKKEFDPSRRDIFRQGMAVAAGVIVTETLLRVRAAQAAKASKADAKYQDMPHDQQECDGCIQFIPGATATANGTCKLVEGSISPKGWCLLFAPKT